MSEPTLESPEITEVLDVWVAGTEEPEFSPTDEGEQEISDHESEARLDEQFGRVVEDDYVFDDGIDEGERMILNMGPQHPSTHGVLRLQIELEGEIIRRTKPIIGYLHTGMEKTGEQLNFSQGGTNVTRMDYLAPFHNELAYSLAVERLLGIEVPPRAAAIRVLLTELNRCSSHLVALATNGMDIGAVSMMIYGFREREQILAFFEKTTGLRMNHNFIRPGGVAADLAPGWKDDVAEILAELPRRLQQYDDLLKDNPHLAGADPRRGSHLDGGGDCLRDHRATAARDRGGVGPAQGVSVLRDREVRVRRGGRTARRRLRPLPGAGR